MTRRRKSNTQDHFKYSHIYTHRDNCAHHAPSESRRSTCTCNFPGCWCTRGRSRHCIQLHTRRHLQKDDNMNVLQKCSYNKPVDFQSINISEVQKCLLLPRVTLAEWHHFNICAFNVNIQPGSGELSVQPGKLETFGQTRSKLIKSTPFF